MSIIRFITQADRDFFFVLNQLHCAGVDCFFSWITNTFLGALLYIFIYFFIRKNLGWYGVALFVINLTLSDQCSASLLKPLFKRFRPFYVEDIHLMHVVGVHTGVYGFPSSHASNTFSFAMLFWKLFKKNYKYTYLFFIWAAFISYGRIYGGMHYPLDIAGGAALGSGLGLGVYFLHTKWRSDLVN